MSAFNDLRLIGITWRLDSLRWVPTEDLSDIVRGLGACMRETETDTPPWADEVMTDRDLAARLCAGCLVIDECLELDLRTAGARAVGVWGGLPDEDRRALHPHWLARGERADRGERR